MTDRDALYRAILSHPADDTPRLAYADWLEENGHCEEAEFIRIECRVAAGAPDDPEFAELLDRREELRVWLAAHMPRPGPKLPARLRLAAGADWWKATHRGFPCFLEADGLSDPTPRAMRLVGDLLPKAFALIPTRWLLLRQITLQQLAEFLRQRGLAALEHLTIQLNSVDDPQDDACRLIAECPYLARLRGLVLNFPIGDAGLSALARSDHLGGLREFALHQCAMLTPPAIRSLGGSASFRGLNVLTLGELGDSSFEELCRIEPLPLLHTLELDDSSFTIESWRQFARSTSFPRLSSLGNATEMATGQAEALAEASNLKLAVLNLRTCSLGNDGALALARAPWLDSLSRLDLSHNRLGASGVAAIAGNRRLVNLRHLDLSFNAPGLGGLRALAANPSLRGLTALLLHGSAERTAGLSSTVLYEFLATLKTPNLRRLGLSELSLGLIGAKALATEKFAKLTRLHVAHCKLNDDAMSLLLGSPVLQNLIELDASRNDLRSSPALLTDRRVMPMLGAANFSDNRIPSDLVRRLKRRPGVVV